MRFKSFFKQNSLVKKACSAALTLAMVANMVFAYPIIADSESARKAEAATTAPYRNVMYYGEWSIYAGQKNYTPDKIPGNYITHLNFAFLDVDAAGNVISCDTWADFENPNVGYSTTSGDPWAGVAPAFIQLRNEYPNMKIGFSVGGWTRSGDFPAMAANATSRKNFAENIAKAAHLYGYDFVDIDWEYPTADRDPDPAGNGVTIDKGCKGSEADTHNFTLLLQDLRAALDKYGEMDNKHYELSVAMSASPTMMAKIEYDQVLEVVDFANMMTYDLCGAWAPYTGHQTALYTNEAYDKENQPDCQFSVDACIQYLYDTYGNSIDASKIVVGIAPYTRGWAGVQNDGRDSNNPGLYATAEPNSVKAADGTTSGTYAYSDIGTLVSQYGLKEYYDETAEAAYYYSADTGYFFTCDNSRSVTAKANYVKNSTGYKNPFNKPLGGLISWMASLDAAAEITKTSHDALFGSGTQLPEQEIIFPAMDNMSATVSVEAGDSGDQYVITIKNNNAVTTGKTQATLLGGAEANVLHYAETFAGTATYPVYYIKTADGSKLTGSSWAAGGTIGQSGDYTTVTMTAWPYCLKPGETATLTLTPSSGTASVSNITEVAMTRRANASGEEFGWTNLIGESEQPTVDEEQKTEAGETKETPVETEKPNETTSVPTTTVNGETSQPEGTGSYPNWSASGVYNVGDLVVYKDKVYECINGHSANTAWTPDQTLTLWKERTDLVNIPTTAPSPDTTNPDGGEDDNYTPNTILPQHTVTGYWHNFVNGSANLKLSDVPSYYDIICVSFTGNTDIAGEVTFELDPDLCTALGGYTKAEFIQDIKDLKAKNQHVIISVGGAEGRIEINSAEAADRFANGLISIIREYGFEGVDIDLEGAAVTGVNYIADALRKVQAEFGDNFIITMAPETYYIQADRLSSNDITTAYLRLALEIKDILTICQPQFYNSGGMNGYGGTIVNPGTVEFLTSLSTLVIEAGLRPDQVAMGVPSTSQAGGGYVSPDVVKTAFYSMINGTTAGSFTPPRAYPTFRGVMTWSINWDATTGYSWGKAMAEAVHALNTEQPTVEPETDETPTEETTTPEVIVAKPTEVTGLAKVSQDGSVVVFNWGQTQEQIASGQSYNVYIDGKLYGNYASATQLTYTFMTSGQHTIKVTAVLNGTETQGATLNVTVQETETPTPPVTEEPTEEPTEKPAEQETQKPASNVSVKINGYQISTTVGGYRTVYTVDDPNKEVVKAGMVYGPSRYAAKEDMVVGGSNSRVTNYDATDTGKLDTSFSDSVSAQSYAMTMKFMNPATAAYYNAEWYVRAYAQLSDGTYIYSDVKAFTIFKVANSLYQNFRMNNKDSHNYLYTNILSVADPSYKEVDFAWNNSIVKPEEFMN